MSQLITEDYVINFEWNSFRVQLLARGTGFATAQLVSRGVDCLCLCLPSKSKSQIATIVATFLAAASDRTENRAQVLLQLTAKLAQQAKSLSFVKTLGPVAHCLLHKLDTIKESWPIFTHSTALFRHVCLWLLLAAQQHTCPPAGNRFPKQVS